MGDSSQDAQRGLRRRNVAIDATPTNINLDLDTDFKIEDGGVIKGTPSPCSVKIFTDDDKKPSSSLMEFRKKQQSFEIHIEDCDEEELSGSDDENDYDLSKDRPHTPAHILQYPDCCGDVVHREQPPQENYLSVAAKDNECLTDYSEGESDNEECMDQDTNPESVIKRVPS